MKGSKIDLALNLELMGIIKLKIVNPSNHQSKTLDLALELGNGF